MRKLGKKSNKFRQETENSWGRCTCTCQSNLYNSYSHSNGTGY
ncbi:MULTISPECIES: hypothetical protein [Clostridium]|jgi:hypothetical protein|nr:MULTISPECIES: hypothetical protein [Clostridium]NRT63656.1 hypothetical protein [Clostridium saccharoperbutylacetonicum]NSB27019.1 hypothetical protein [Clostridium saccharoperbutylacetonicum]NSB30181.1 hypothetical protein [Clostridium saccharoperbutylacetonicum]NSB40503.1 hypothetical protein [Clostridium saccharoperbutylacetonicum]